MAWNIIQSEASIDMIAQSEASIDNNNQSEATTYTNTIDQSETSILPGGPQPQSSRHLFPPLASEIVTSIIILFTSFYHFIKVLSRFIFPVAG